MITIFDLFSNCDDDDDKISVNIFGINVDSIVVSVDDIVIDVDNP